MSYKISVIIPVYNAEKTIGNILDKLARQDYENIEIVTVNDGSKDASLEVIRNRAEQDGRIVVVDQPNKGASTARNVGISRSTGDFIIFIDSDDDIHTGLITELVRGVDPSTDLVVCGMDINGKSISPVEKYVSGQKDILKHTLRSLLTENILYGPCCKLFRRDLIASRDILFPEGVNYGEDTIFVLNFLTHSNGMRIRSDVLYFYNFQASGLAFNNRLDKRSLAARKKALGNYMWRREAVTATSIVLYTVLRLRWLAAYIKSAATGART